MDTLSSSIKFIYIHTNASSLFLLIAFLFPFIYLHFTYEIFMADAFKLYDLRHTGYIEREEVCPALSFV